MFRQSQISDPLVYFIALDIDLAGIELGIEWSGIPRPIVVMENGIVGNLTWRSPDHWKATHPPLGFRVHDAPLSCIGYVSPKWKTLALAPRQPGL